MELSDRALMMVFQEKQLGSRIWSNTWRAYSILRWLMESAQTLRNSAAASGSWIWPVLMKRAWTWFRSLMVLHDEISGKSVEG